MVQKDPTNQKKGKKDTANGKKHLLNRKNQKYGYIIRKWSTKHRFFYRFMNPFMTKIIPIFFKFECFGIENIKRFPEHTPIILASNHRSHLDGLVGFTTVFPPFGKRRYLTTITPGAVLKENYLFKMMRYLGGYPIDRNRPEISVDYLFETLKIGLAVGIFPQGGRIARSPIEDYHKLSEEGRSGVGRLVLRMKGKVPVIPIYMHGTAEALSRGSVIPKFGSYISVTVGEPIYFDEFEDKEWDTSSQPFHDNSRIVTDKIMKKIKDLCYETEKGLFDLLEKKLGIKIDDLKLTDSQNKNLRRFLRRYSHYAPKDFISDS